ncbi:MAG TPA: prepilin-type N-terminal cleavage/methylation domain-containing protein [Thiotrichaceae bacterium]|nr:prepilin-type N-terminal cleavage/methylation domain-containing protein [Thiotrichaceae bacterium]
MMMNNKGFTLMELLIVLAILAILLVTVIPSFSDFIAKNKKNALLTDLYSTFALAQGETVKRRIAVTIRPFKSANWTEGWEVFTDHDRNGIKNDKDELLNTLSYSDQSARLDSTLNQSIKYIIFKPNGAIKSQPNYSTFNIFSCGKGEIKTKAVIKVQSSGNYKITNNNEISCS